MLRDGLGPGWCGTGSAFALLPSHIGLQKASGPPGLLLALLGWECVMQ